MDILPLTVNNIDYLFTKLNKNSYDAIIMQKILKYRRESIESFIEALNSRDTAFFALIDRKTVRGFCFLRKLGSSLVPIKGNDLEEETTWVIMNFTLFTEITEKNKVKFLKNVTDILKDRSASKFIAFLTNINNKDYDNKKIFLKNKFTLLNENDQFGIYIKHFEDSNESSLKIISDFNLPETIEKRIDVIPGIPFNNKEILLKALHLPKLTKSGNLPVYFHITDREFFINHGCWPGIYVDRTMIHNFVDY